jgi:hypothetical protein
MEAFGIYASGCDLRGTAFPEAAGDNVRIDL